MKKSDIVVFAALILLSVVLLCLWFYLGFDQVRSLPDVALSIIWWVVAALFIGGIYIIETTRRKQIRTIYVSRNALYNSEYGLVEYSTPEERVDKMEQILASLKYGYKKKNPPSRQNFNVEYVVRTDDFATGEDSTGAPMKISSSSAFDSPAENLKWKGTVTRIMGGQDGEERTFSTVRALQAALA